MPLKDYLDLYNNNNDTPADQMETVSAQAMT